MPVHVVLGAGEYAIIKRQTLPHVGKEGEPITEFPKLGWFIMSPGEEFDRNGVMLTQTSNVEYEELCRMDVLGLTEGPDLMYWEFKEQLVRSEDCWYETGPPWKEDCTNLPTNFT